MARILASSVSEPNSGAYKSTFVPQTKYPSHLYREQFFWRQDGEVVTPEIDGLFPNSAPAGGSDLRLYVHGTGFTGESIIVFNDVEEPTTLDATGVLSTGVRAGMFEVPAEVEVKVKTGDEESNILLFTFY
jgi:hypothetical protein